MRTACPGHAGPRWSEAEGGAALADFAAFTRGRA